MKRKQYTTKQIIGFLKAHEAGTKVADLMRKYKYGGLEVSEAKRLKELEHENAQLKKLLAEAELVLLPERTPQHSC